MLRVYVACLCAALCALAVWDASASALAPSPGWEVMQATYPTSLQPGGEGTLQIDLFNVGSVASGRGFTVSDALPHGVTVTSATFLTDVLDEEEISCSGSTVVLCTIKHPVYPGEIARLQLSLSIEAGVSGAAPNVVTISGGGASASASNTDRIAFGAEPGRLGFASVDSWFTNMEGTTDTQAGSHPYEFTAAFNFNATGGEDALPVGGEELRNIEFRVPSGVIGDPNAVAQCPRQQLDISFANTETCPANSQIGIDRIGLGGSGGRFILAVPVYNMVPPADMPAQFGFSIFGFSVLLDAAVRTGGDDGVTVRVDNLPQLGVVSNVITLWGVPGESSHDMQRAECLGQSLFSEEENGESPLRCPIGAPLTPFLTLPTSCGAPPTFAVDADSWTNTDVFAEASSSTHEGDGAPVGITGCDHLGFEPSLSVAPDTGQADTPAGLTADLKIPQEGLTASTYRLTGNAESLAPADLQQATMTLPEGLVISPGRAVGLVACQPSEDGVGTEGPPSCPNASLIGTVQVSSPLLPGKLEGDVYLLQSSPPNIKILIAPSGFGVNLKVVGDISLNETTGQLTATFPEAPPLPFTDFKLSFSGGGQAALATPVSCGAYATSSDFQPWSSPFVPDAFGSSAFAIVSGPGGSACSSPLPFTPSMTAGATTDQAGGYTDFSLLLSRGDGQQRISKLQFKTPPGLLGMISHVSLCEEPQAAKGQCPAGSQIGHTVVGAGPGPFPLYVPETGRSQAPIYIGGPYEGAPYSLIIAVPVIAGPFNLGTTVVRGKIEVDPETSQLTITTDPLPTILDGVPVDLRTINAVIDRKEFMFNPTNCNPQAFSGTATSTEGTNAALSSPFQVGSCRSLGFKPGFRVSTSARTSRTRGASLHVSLTLPDEGGLSSIANVRRVKVSLPKQLPSPLKTLQKACLEKVFAESPASCPVASQVGQVKVSTPVLPGGLSGTAYFVSHGGAKYPELILVLAGENGVTVQVHGETFISKQGITTAMFATVPDVPFSSVELTLPEREYPALTANGNLCQAQAAGKLLMPTELVGQNGLVIQQSTKIAVAGCPKTAHKKARKEKAKTHKARGKKR